jgi:hypothetical protein
MATNQCNGAVPAPTKDCVIDHYYDISWDEKRRDKNGSVCKPRSVHFAFKNAGYKLGELLNSDWSDCLELECDSSGGAVLDRSRKGSL